MCDLNHLPPLIIAALICYALSGLCSAIAALVAMRENAKRRQANEG